MRTKRLIAVLLSFLLMFGMVDVPVEGASAESAENADMNDYLDVISELIGLVAKKGMDPSTLGGVASSAGKWAESRLISIFFPEMQQTTPLQAIQALSAKLDTLIEEIATMGTMIESAELTRAINDYTRLSAVPIDIMEDAYSTLDKIEQKMKDDSTYDPTSERLDALTTYLGITSLDDCCSLLNPFDNYMRVIVNLVTNSYQVPLKSGTVSMTLLEIVEELMHRKYKWEHQAYAEWLGYQRQIVSAAFKALNLWQLSIAARMTRLKDAGKEIPESLHTLADEVNNKLQVLNEKTQPLLVTKETKLPDSIRHYWYNGRSYYFYTALNTQRAPQEKSYAGVSGNAIQYLQGLRKVQTSQTSTFQIVTKFWEPLVKYRMNDQKTNLVSADILETIWSDYGKNTSLLDIFFLESEGGFDLPVGDYKNWNFVVDPVGKYAMQYAPHLFKADQVRAACLSVSGTPMLKEPAKGTQNSAEYTSGSVALAYYHNSSVDSRTQSDMIGIGYIGTTRDGDMEEHEIEWVTVEELPETGDRFDPIPWCMVGFLAATGAFLLLWRRRKKGIRTV